MADDRHIVFDYRALRLLVGLIALAIPFVVTGIATTELSSISASYHTKARDAFVGLLFFVAAFLWAYNGHTPTEGRASKIAALVAILVAVFPTACDTCESGIVSKIHYAAAFIFFSVLVYFCFGPYRQRTAGQPGKKWVRHKIYLACGTIMVACMLAMVLAKFGIPKTVNTWAITYWAEAIALGAFGISWIVAGKPIAALAESDERLRLF